MRKLPDITDTAAMIDRGRHSVLMSARNEACDDLRNVFVSVQSAPMDKLEQHAEPLKAIANRLIEIQTLWDSI